jgi:hypothetical protein
MPSGRSLRANKLHFKSPLYIQAYLPYDQKIRDKNPNRTAFQVIYQIPKSIPEFATTAFPKFTKGQ